MIQVQEKEMKMITRYLDPTNDVAFKKVFEDKTSLMSFLNSILKLDESKKIIDLEYISPETLPDFGIGKRALFDLKVRDASGSIYVVEMQNRKQDSFIKRVQFYSSYAYTSQIQQGVDHGSLMPVVLIAIVRNKIFPDNVPCVSYHKMLETNTGQNLLYDVSYVFIELEKFNKNESELISIEDEWLFFFADSQQIKNLPTAINDSAVLDAFKTIEYFNFTADQHDAYVRSRLAAEADEITIENKYKKGREEGREEGKKEGKIEIAKQSLQAGLDINIISQITGLSIDEIRNLT